MVLNEMVLNYYDTERVLGSSQQFLYFSAIQAISLQFKQFLFVYSEGILPITYELLNEPKIKWPKYISFFSFYQVYTIRTYAKAGPPLPPCTK